MEKFPEGLLRALYKHVAEYGKDKVFTGATYVYESLPDDAVPYARAYKEHNIDQRLLSQWVAAKRVRVYARASKLTFVSANDVAECVRKYRIRKSLRE